MCELESYKVVNSVFLNHSTDDVLCETGWDVHTIMNYLGVIISHPLFSDTKHNVKNCRYKFVGGSCAALIGFYFFVIWLLNMFGASKYLIQVEDFVSDTVLLRIVYDSTTIKLILLDITYFGNKKVTIIYPLL